MSETWSQEKAREIVWTTLTEMENFMMGRCKNLVARNLSSAVNDFISTPSDETKAKFDSILEEVRRIDLARSFFEENVDKNKNAKFYESALKDHDKKMQVTPEPIKGIDAEAEQRSFVEQIEKARAEALEKRKKELGL
jgi:hypothetical protein